MNIDIPYFTLFYQNPWTYFSLFSVFGLILGIISEKLVLRIMAKFTKKTQWAIDDILIESIKGKTIIWLTLLGLHFGSFYLPLAIKHREILNMVFTVIIAITITSTLASLVKNMITTYFKSVFKVYATTSLLANILVILIYIIGFLVILQIFNVSILPVLTAFGVGGLAIALAMQDTLSNIFSGVHIVLSRKVRPGDFIELDTGEKGFVTDITWRNTTVRSIRNNMVIVPNSKMASVIITNYYQPVKETSLKIPVAVSYSSDLDHVEKVTISVAKKVQKKMEKQIKDFEPFIRYREFGDFSINFVTILRAVEYTDIYTLRHEFIKLLHKTYKEEGIQIPFPTRTIYNKAEQKDI
jgi:small-conductance mechanosensitive channel